MSMFTEADYALINLGVCIKSQADRLGIEHEGIPLEGVVVRIAERAAALAEQGETEWEYGVQALGEVRIRGPLEEAQLSAEIWGDDKYPASIVCRRKAGPWLPVLDTTNTESED